MKGPSAMAIVVSILLFGTCVTAVVAENCRIKDKKACANGSTIALTVVMALLIAVTAAYWFKPIYFPDPPKLYNPGLPRFPTGAAAGVSRFPSGYGSYR